MIITTGKFFENKKIKPYSRSAVELNWQKAQIVGSCRGVQILLKMVTVKSNGQAMKEHKRWVK